MKIIIGLGNPGKKFDNTRHNAGFIALDLLLAKYGFDKEQAQFHAQVYTGKVNNEKIMWIRPLTFMNDSGYAVHLLMDYYKFKIDDVLVIYDEKDFPVGKTQFKSQGSSAGHNGIKSLIQHFKTEEFKRLRIGIGQPTGNYSLVDWVLSKFSTDELTSLTNSVNQVAGFLDDWTKNEPFEKIMSKYNTPRES